MTLSRLGTSVNLEVDGRYDLLLMNFPNGYPNGVVDLSIGVDPRKVTGVQKVAQVFLYCLLTTRGSDPVKADFGTDFTSITMLANRSKNPSDMIGQMITAVKDAESQVKLLLNTGTRDKASQMESADIRLVDSDTEGIHIQLRIVTRAGVKAAVALPFPQSDLELN